MGGLFVVGFMFGRHFHYICCNGFRSVPAVVPVYKSMYAVSLKTTTTTLKAAELCQLLCNTLQQVAQLQQQTSLHDATCSGRVMDMSDS